MIRLLLLFLFIFFLSQSVQAQQTVFNVPNADATEKGVIFLQHESQFIPWSPQSWIGTHYSAIGIGYNTELDMTLFNVAAPRTNNMTLGIGFKSAMPIKYLDEIFKERELKFTIGSEVLVSLQGNGVGNWTYFHFSGRLPKINTRLSAGLSLSSRQVFGTDAIDFIAAIEQPINEKISLLADWYSSKDNYAGFLIMGCSYKLPKDTNIYLGFQIPNTDSNGDFGFVAEISKLISLKKTP